MSLYLADTIIFKQRVDLEVRKVGELDYLQTKMKLSGAD